MLQIRKSVFETNSSSTHSLTMCTLEEYQKFSNGELYYSDINKKLITKEEVNEKYEEFLSRLKSDTFKYYNEDFNEMDEKEIFEHFLKDENLYNYEQLEEKMEDFEEFYEQYTTIEGKVIVAFGYYGYE